MEKPKRFVVQRHQKESEPTHWDLMLERDGILETYRVAEPPEKWGKEAIEAVKIFDHPLKFLSYEGSVNEGKGRVEIADGGTYRLIKKDENQKQISFAGKLLREEFQLCLIKEDRWELRNDVF
ncbi:MAG: DNA polymerase ligase N-terminal domain-containing protein [Sedimentisphaerales bacterium]|jgi:bifunctional non-homologous end joining protein LigD